MKKMMIMAVATALGAAPAVAQMQGMDHSGMNHGQMMRPTPANPYPQAEMDMHQKMMSAMGADATETWVRKWSSTTVAASPCRVSCFARPRTPRFARWPPRRSQSRPARSAS